jgi:hypothetical protein
MQATNTIISWTVTEVLKYSTERPWGHSSALCHLHAISRSIHSERQCWRNLSEPEHRHRVHHCNSKYLVFARETSPHKTWQPRLGQLAAWEYVRNPSDHKHFINMLRVSPEVFDTLLLLINNDSVPKQLIITAGSREDPTCRDTLLNRLVRKWSVHWGLLQYTCKQLFYVCRRCSSNKISKTFL